MKLGVLRDGTAVVVNDTGVVPLRQLGFESSLHDFIRAGTETWARVLEAVHSTQANEQVEPEAFAAPLAQPSKIIAIGLNYLDHATESKMDLPKTPLVFSKLPNSITGPTDPIVIPLELTREVDYEVELAVVIGKKAKSVPQAEALDYVFGYTILNDVSARDLQFADGQWIRGKSLDTFCPLGPVIVTADEIPDPQGLRLGCDVNGERLQNGSTKDMIFNVAALISPLSHAFTLEPGDLIATGTPSGVGFSRKPPVFLKPGDTVRTWIEGIGELNNTVVAL